MSKLWSNDEELFKLARQELFVAVVGDIMDKLGFYHQFLPPTIRPLDSKMVVMGRAMTVLEADYLLDENNTSSNPTLSQPFGLMLDALDNLQVNEVYTCTGGAPKYALWGELMSTRAIKLGATGAVMNGYARDTHGILDLEFPTFCFGSYAQDQAPRGRVIDYRVPIEIEGTKVNPGDIVFGDVDGVCIVPREAEDDIFNGAIEKARGEKTVRKAIEAGMSARDAFEKYGIL